MKNKAYLQNGDFCRPYIDFIGNSLKDPNGHDLYNVITRDLAKICKSKGSNLFVPFAEGTDTFAYKGNEIYFHQDFDSGDLTITSNNDQCLKELILALFETGNYE